MDNKRLLKKAKYEKVELFTDRLQKQKPFCPFGSKGVCCRICAAGPCRIMPGKSSKGVCGANADVIASRNLLRTIACGAAVHSDHAREIVLALLDIANGRAIGYGYKGIKKIRRYARLLGKKSTGRIRRVAREVAYEALEDFRRQEGVFRRREGDFLNWLKINATKDNIKKWKKLDILPVSADYEINHVMHQTTMGNDAEPCSLLLSCLKLGLVDGYAGLHMATDFQDMIFGVPKPIKAKANLGVIKEDYINIAVHGHIPLLSEKIAEWAEKLNNKAKKTGARGINIVGVCCTGNEILMRRGVHLAAHVLQSELAIATGAIEAMIVDAQCIYPSLQDISSCYHTKLITTTIAKMPGALHIQFNTENANESAKKIILEAINNYKNRFKTRVYIPKNEINLYAGFSSKAIISVLKKLNKRKPLKPLINALRKGKILGIAAVVGCVNPKLYGKNYAETLIKELIKKNMLVLTTGCIAHISAQSGLMLPEARKFSGDGLKSFLKKLNIPPVLHMGSCVDTSRTEKFIKKISKYLKVPIYKLPVIASAPEYMTEKSVSIGTWLLATGITTHINPIPPVTGSKFVTKFLTKDMEKITGSKILIAKNPKKAAQEIIKEIKNKRKNLGWKA